MNVIVRVDLNEAEAWDVIDTLSDTQISALASLFPPRCILPDETLDAHHRYAGKVELVEKLVKRRAANPRPIRVDASDPKSIERLAHADVPRVTTPTPSSSAEGPGPAGSPGSSASATARATHARANQAPRRAGGR